MKKGTQNGFQDRKVNEQTLLQDSDQHVIYTTGYLQFVINATNGQMHILNATGTSIKNIKYTP